MYKYTCIYIYTHTYVYVCVYRYMYVYMHMCIYTYAHIFLFIREKKSQSNRTGIKNLVNGILESKTQFS